MKMHEGKAKESQSVNHNSPQQSRELKTDRPLSEKDEVKKAETRTRKALKDHL